MNHNSFLNTLMLILSCFNIFFVNCLSFSIYLFIIEYVVLLFKVVYWSCVYEYCRHNQVLIYLSSPAVQIYYIHRLRLVVVVTVKLLDPNLGPLITAPGEAIPHSWPVGLVLPSPLLTTTGDTLYYYKLHNICSGLHTDRF